MEDKKYALGKFQLDKNNKYELKSENDFQECAKRAYKQANGYAELVQIVVKENGIQRNLICPVFSNIALSCELFMKGIIFNNHKKPPWEHNLIDLYKDLPPEVRQIIKDRHSCSNDKKENFETCLKDVSEAFKVLRYRYEYTGLCLNVIFMLELLDILKSFCDQYFTSSNL